MKSLGETLFLYLKNVLNVFCDDKKYNILDIAPFRNLQNSLKKSKNIKYVSVDLNSPLADLEMSITDLKFKNDFFDLFWDQYHTITNLQKTDREAAMKYWAKLSPAEKGKAKDNIQPYFDSLDEKKYCKKARTYLGDKNFNDEFIVQRSPKRAPDHNDLVIPNWRPI